MKVGSYPRAASRRGPQRCWFSRNAESYGVVCGGEAFGNAFASRYLRVGAWMKTSPANGKMVAYADGGWGITHNGIERQDHLNGMLKHNTQMVKKDGKL